jgi:hypothetical protein
LQTTKKRVLDLSVKEGPVCVDDVLDKFNIVGGLGTLPGFRPERIDFEMNDPHFEHCVEVLKEKLRAFGDTKKMKHPPENLYHQCWSRRSC